MVELAFSKIELDERIATIERFVRDQVESAGVDGVVLGLSGGVDSATAAGLSSRALGSENVHPLMLPAAPTSDTSVKLARSVAATFSLELEVFDVEPIVESALELFPESPNRTSIANLRARSRMLAWYLIANQRDLLVIGGGNRTEWLTGYFTKFGDGAVDCLPLGNLYKQQVRQIASRIGVPEAVVERSPTAELWPNQTDERELGLDYDTLDAILFLRTERGCTVEETANTLDVERREIKRIYRLVERTEHKRQIPPMPNF